jgi:hypothetical protein
MKKMSFCSKVLIFSSFVFASISFSSCNKDDANYGQGEATFEITDAPIDNPNVKAAFVTITEIRVDGKVFQGFKGPKTVNLLALQNGKTEVLGTGKLDAKTYSNLTLVVDIETDASGSSPGCYVLTKDDVKHKLALGGQTIANITAQSNYTITQGANAVVIDFDLRKAVRVSSNAQSYAFANASNLANAIRVVNKKVTGTINGTYKDNSSKANSYLVAYAYKKGTFKADMETKGEVLFANAVNSCLVRRGTTSSNFTLSFLEAGDYEVHFARFTDNDQNGHYSFETMLEVKSENNISVNNVKVNAGANVGLSLSLLGTI